MKKNVMFALLALMLNATVVSASTIAVVQPNVEVVGEKVKIKPEELPEAVKTALSSEDYAGWEITAAYKYTDENKYEVELKSGADVTTLMFDKDGKAIG